ncbi:MAG: aminopeptidase P family protein [Bacteroidota bacterium]
MQRIRETILAVSLKVFLVLFLLATSLLSVPATAQQNFYDTDLLKPEFHAGKREALRKLMPENSVAFLFANPMRVRTNDVDYQYVQDPDLYYLTGLMEENAVLMLLKSATEINGKSVREVLFIMGRDSAKEVWTGRRLGLDETKERLGIEEVVANTDFNKYLTGLVDFTKVWAKFPVDIKESKSLRGRLGGLVWQLKERAESNNIEISEAPLLNSMGVLRQNKSMEELVLMQKAIDITCEGLAEAIRATKPGMTEYQAQAIVEFYFKHRGSEYPGYGSISGGGANTCVLHYVTNRKRLGPDDMLLMDMGAEYHGYTADVTRTIPVSGKFNQEQKAIYELVLKAQEAGIQACRKGRGFYDPHQAATEIISQGLLDLGIIKEKSAVRRYFNHGSSHYLGLEVHDAGSYGPLQPSQVITVEPGIYIPAGSPCDKKWWDIGVRIEDDILITDNEPVNMSIKLPRQVADLEKLMAEPSLFDSLK